MMDREAVSYSTYTLDRRENGMLIAALSFASAAVSVLFFNSVFPAVFGIFLYKPVMRETERLIAQRRQVKLRNGFRDLLFLLGSSFSTGRHMTEALIESERELSAMYAEEEPILLEVRHMIYRIQECGEMEVKVLMDFSSRAGLEEIDDMVRVYRACRESGGDMVRAMNRTAKMINEEIQIEEDIRLQISQRKYEGRIITVIPVLIICFLRVSSPGYLSVLYESLEGRVIMAAALCLTGYTYRMIERITDVAI